MQLVLNTQQRIHLLARLMEGWIAPASTVLDLGCGTGYVTRYLGSHGHKVTPVDVRDKSRVPGITPIIYDGVHLPFRNDHFDYCLLLTVLHHTPSPELVLREATRVARRLVVIEDIYRTPTGRFLAIAGCSISNREFFGHPHTNRDDTGWRDAFGGLGLELLDARYVRELSFVLPFYHGAYLLRPH